MNEDIITALKNGIERGETLQDSMRILINSGYNAREVDESSRYVSAGVTPHLQTRPDEELTMPEKKGFFSRFKRSKTSKIKSNKDSQAEKIKQEITKNQQISTLNPVKQIASKKTKKVWIKEIILVLILLILIGVLVATIFFKDTILNLIS